MAERAFTVWFTGLSGSGKTTLANLLEPRLKQRGFRVQHIDGDIIRQDLTADLGFSREDRDKNISRAAFVAGLLTRNGVVVLASFISPYREARAKAREKIGAFVEVFVDCPLDVCVQRDVKGLYARARAGKITNFTGVSDPYEVPEHPEIVIRTDLERPAESVDHIIGALEDLGYLTRPGLVAPHGGKLVERLIPAAERDSLRKSLQGGIEVNYQTAKEVENLATGIYSPLEGFLPQADYEKVLTEGRLADGTPWAIPLLLHVPSPATLTPGLQGLVALTHQGQLVGTLEARESYQIDRERYAQCVYGTVDPAHPGVSRILKETEWVVAGPVSLIEPLATPYPAHRRTPRETRRIFTERGWKTVVAFQTRNAPHLGHEYLQKAALTVVDGLFINPVIGDKKVGDFEDDAIIAGYEAFLSHYLPPASSLLGILEYEMKYAGPREAIHHAIMRQNFGCSHLIVGRDHAGVGSYYGAYDAQLIFDRYPDLGIRPIKFRSFYYCRKCLSVTNERVCPHGPEDHVNFSGTALRAQLMRGDDEGAAAGISAAEAAAEAPIRPEVLAAIRKLPKAFVE